MSKHNKANKSNYVQAGRLSPDDLAREQKKQSEISAHAKGGERVSASARNPRHAPADRTPALNQPTDGRTSMTSEAEGRDNAARRDRPAEPAPPSPFKREGGPGAEDSGDDVAAMNDKAAESQERQIRPAPERGR